MRFIDFNAIALSFFPRRNQQGILGTISDHRAGLSALLVSKLFFNIICY